MLNLALQIVCTFLFAVGILFVFIELRTNYDRSFLYFGVSLILLCMLSAIDIWAIGQGGSPQKILYWSKIFQIVSFGFFVFSLWYMMLITRTFNPAFMKIWCLLALVFSTTFLTDWMLRLKDGEVVATILYTATIIPAVLFWFGLLVTLNVVALRRVKGVDKKVLSFHLAGIIALCASGITDLLVASFIGQGKLPIPSFTILGVLGFGIMASLIFTERFLMLLKERQRALAQVKAAYTELEEVASLKQIGESTAIINHEIRNYMTSIVGMADMVRRKYGENPGVRKRMETIVTTAMNLMHFSEDILSLSRVRALKDKRRINIEHLIQNCVNNNFTPHKESFVFEGFDGSTFVHADWARLDQAFVNLFKNAVEAASAEPLRVVVRLIKGPAVLLVIIEDNGTGCSQQDMQCLFKAFFTTKKDRHGTGLGMSITRTIIESHGGRISAYSKNLVHDGGHGIKFEIALPLYEMDEGGAKDEKDPVILLKEGLEDLETIIRVLQNVRVNPHVVQQPEEIQHKGAGTESMSVLGTAANITRASRILPRNKRLFVLSRHRDSLYVLRAGAGEQPAYFSEEYVLSHLLRTAAAEEHAFPPA